LFSASQAGLVNNLNDALAWGLFPLMFADRGYSLVEIGFLTAIYPAVWGVGQLATGAWSDRIGRKPLIVGGMLLQSIGIASIIWAAGFWLTAGALTLMGAGTACVYPTLLATVSDVAHPTWRATSIGVYRLWRDGGYVIGALVVGLLADAVGTDGSVAGVALLTAASGLLALFLMRESLASS
jgi:MFS family permease